MKGVDGAIQRMQQLILGRLDGGGVGGAWRGQSGRAPTRTPQPAVGTASTRCILSRVLMMLALVRITVKRSLAVRPA